MMNEALQRRYRAAFHDHLARHTPERLVRAYLDVLEGTEHGCVDDQLSQTLDEGARDTASSAATPQRGECPVNARRSCLGAVHQSMKEKAIQ
jgi:hypothetical protein